jgi:hypothetical protein
MGVSIKFRRGTAAEHTTFTGAEGEITVLKSDAEGDPWRLKVHDGTVSYTVPTIDSTDTVTNKTLTNVVLTGTLKDTSGNLLGTIAGGKLVLGAGALTLDQPEIVDQGTTKALELMVSRVSRKTQMILGD